MEIIYKHKQTGMKISHQELKEKQLNVNLVGIDNFGDIITTYAYKYYEIPFSDDFETICVTTDFTIDELSEMACMISYSPDNHIELREKLIKVLNNKLKVRNPND